MDKRSLDIQASIKTHFVSVFLSQLDFIVDGNFSRGKIGFLSQRKATSDEVTRV